MLTCRGTRDRGKQALQALSKTEPGIKRHAKMDQQISRMEQQAMSLA